MSSIVTAGCLLLVLALAVVESQYVNDFDKDARLECPLNQIFSFIGSIHSNHFEDRRWQFHCGPVPTITYGCFWTHYVNPFHQKLLYTCPRNMVLAGMMSYHSNHYEDRVFMVQCCSVSGKSTSNCYKTGFVNDWDDVMNYFVPGGQAITGVYSIHDTHYKDRRFKFTVCNLVNSAWK